MKNQLFFIFFVFVVSASFVNGQAMRQRIASSSNRSQIESHPTERTTVPTRTKAPGSSPRETRYDAEFTREFVATPETNAGFDRVIELGTKNEFSNTIKDAETASTESSASIASTGDSVLPASPIASSRMPESATNILEISARPSSIALTDTEKGNYARLQNQVHLATQGVNDNPSQQRKNALASAKKAYENYHQQVLSRIKTAPKKLHTFSSKKSARPTAPAFPLPKTAVNKTESAEIPTSAPRERKISPEQRTITEKIIKPSVEPAKSIADGFPHWLEALNTDGSNVMEARFPDATKQANDDQIHSAAAKIQNAWQVKQARAKIAEKNTQKLVENDAALQRAYQEATNAHTKIATTWRNFKANKDAEMAKKNNAATNIQRMVRGHQARQAANILRNKPLETLKKNLTEHMSAVIDKNSALTGNFEDIRALKKTADSYFDALKESSDASTVQSIKEQTYNLMKVLVDQQREPLAKLKTDAEQQIAAYEAGPAVKAREPQINALKKELIGSSAPEFFEVDAEGHSIATPKPKITADTTKSNASLSLAQRGELRLQQALTELNGTQDATAKKAKATELHQQQILWDAYSKALTDALQAAGKSINNDLRAKLATARTAAINYFNHIIPTTEPRNSTKSSWNDRTSVQEEENFILEQLNSLGREITNKEYTTHQTRLSQVSDQISKLDALETTIDESLS